MLVFSENLESLTQFWVGWHQQPVTVGVVGLHSYLRLPGIKAEGDTTKAKQT